MLHITKEHIEEMKRPDAGDAARAPQPSQGRMGLSDLQMRDILNADALDLIEETVKAGAMPPVPASGGWAS